MDRMGVTELVDSMPLWGVFLASLIITVISINLGFRMGQRTRGRLTGDKKAHTGPLAAAALSLLAFMLAIVFGAAESRFSEMKHVALDEANAIGTAFLRADLLPETDRAAIRGLLREYVDLRIEAIQTDSTQRIEQAIRRSEELHSEMWSRAVAIANDAPTPVTALFVQSLNEVIDLHEKRVTLVIRYRLPGFVWIVLYGLATLSMAMSGYDGGLSGSRRIFTFTLSAATAFSVVLAMVVALDRPNEHRTTVMQAALIDLQEDIHRSMESGP